MRNARPRARELGIPFDGVPGPFNAITDVPGVTVGHSTIVKHSGTSPRGYGPVRTGVTVIHPLGPSANRPVLAGRAVINGTGEWTGMHVVDELGQFSGPVALTGTANLATVHAGLVRWARSLGHLTEDELTMRLLAVVGETLDAQLNDVFANAMTEQDVAAALIGAASGPVAEGNVGGGTGMVAYEFKGGIGTSSRTVVTEGYPPFVVAALLQANHGRRSDLRIAGIPIGQKVTDLLPSSAMDQLPNDADLAAGQSKSSLLIVLATDAPLLPHQLNRLARRAVLGLGRNGSTANNLSGEFVLAFSTWEPTISTGGVSGLGVTLDQSDLMNAMFAAAAQVVEESLVNQLIASETMEGVGGRTVHALPQRRVLGILRRHGRLMVGH